MFDRIQFDVSKIGYDNFAHNGEHVVELMQSLLARNAISKARMLHYTDPEYRSGRMKGSRRDLLLRNLKTDEEVTGRMVRQGSGGEAVIPRSEGGASAPGNDRSQ
ncbi:MAG: hypothetical protein E6G97_09310 [Alphaproteobacteria bacterium]|nr:MAG: hypothetical protein E6G97_09310 [Alphaproteobacteria bacterium]